MPQAVRFQRYGAVDVLRVVEVPRPVPGHGHVVVRVRAAGINPGEAAIRAGLLHERWPATFPSGQGSDLAGVVDEVGEGVSGLAVGDEVIGFTHDRASHAELVAVDADHLTPRPPGVPWEVAGALFVVGATAYAAASMCPSPVLTPSPRCGRPSASWNGATPSARSSSFPDAGPHGSAGV